MTDRCRMNILEEIPPLPPLPTVMYIGEIGTSTIHKCSISGTTFTSVDTLTVPSTIHQLDTLMLSGSGNTLYYSDRDSYVAVIDTSDMSITASGSAGTSTTYLCGIANDGFMMFNDPYLTCYGDDGGGGLVKKAIDGSTSSIQASAEAGQAFLANEGFCLGHRTNYPMIRLIGWGNDTSDSKDRIVRINPTSLVVPLGGIPALAFDVREKDSTTEIGTVPEYFEMIKALELTDPTKFIVVDNPAGYISFHEFGNPNYKAQLAITKATSLDVYKTNARLTNNNALFYISDGVLRVIEAVESAGPGDEYTMTNASSIDLGLTVSSIIAI